MKLVNKCWRTLKSSLKNAKTEAAKPFTQEQELKDKTARLAELNIMLDMGHQDNELLDGELEDTEPIKQKESYER